MRRLLIDIERLVEQRDASARVQCEYLYHRHNEGELSLMETAEFAVYCRQCKDSFCVKACPKDALERQEDGVVKRYNLRCVGCGSCTLACPFGTIIIGVMNYVTPKCDLCLQQLQEDPGYVPLCARTAPDGILRLMEEDEDLADSEFAVGDRLVVKAPNWRFKERKS